MSISQTESAFRPFTFSSHTFSTNAPRFAFVFTTRKRHASVCTVQSVM